MLKHLGYDGAYRDEDISVSAMLENPTEHGLEPATLVFSAILRSMENGTPALSIEGFTFYVMDEDNRIYNTTILQRSPNVFITMEFNTSFLFQDLRLAFYNPISGRLEIMELNAR